MFCNFIVLAQTTFIHQIPPQPHQVFQGNKIKKKSCDIVIVIFSWCLQEIRFDFLLTKASHLAIRKTIFSSSLELAFIFASSLLWVIKTSRKYQQVFKLQPWEEWLTHSTSAAWICPQLCGWSPQFLSTLQWNFPRVNRKWLVSSNRNNPNYSYASLFIVTSSLTETKQYSHL